VNSRLIIMDEPTSALSGSEVDRLVGIVRTLRQQGVAVMFVTHRLEEAMALCDRVTILRDGRLSATLQKDELAIPTFIEKMVGREASNLYKRPEKRHQASDVRLSVRGLRSAVAAGRQHGTYLHGIDLDVRAGEILGIAGLVGAGRTEFARAVFGADPSLHTSFLIDGQEVRIRSPRDAIRHGIGLVPEDRKQQALFLQLAIRQNFSIASLDRFMMAGWVVDEARETRELQRFRELMHVKMTGPDQLVVNLSGGNQQKVVLSRWLLHRCRVLVLDEPTRGVDVGAKSEIYRLVADLAKGGLGVLMVSSEMDELLGLATRILVMRDGALVAEVDGAEATELELLHHAVAPVDASAPVPEENA
jgi:inositol transport system ATP-binding protein